MALNVLVIAGTLAPKQSQFYYRSLIDTVANVVGNDSVYFEVIPGLGLGDTYQAAKTIGKKYLEDTEEDWIIVGHSQGGMLASLLAIEHELSQIAKDQEFRVKAVIPIASPLAGTVWTDPINMPVRLLVEGVSRVTGGRVRLRPKLRKLIAPIPVVKSLATHSDISEMILEYLANQTTGHYTHSIVGLADMLVVPHRSAHPVGHPDGKRVYNYLIALQAEYDLFASRLPDNVVHIKDKAGHISIVNNPLVHALIAKIIIRHMREIAQAS